MPIYCISIDTPVGTMTAGVTDAGVCLFDFAQRHMGPVTTGRVRRHLGAELIPARHPLHDDLEAQVRAYFEGTLTAFDLPLQLAGSPFQRSIWRHLLDIPYGQTRSYQQQARRYGDPKAIRAVAAANGANSIAIIVPCHRVIGANGSLTGYAGGLERKKWLLAHEQRHGNVSAQGSLFGI